MAPEVPNQASSRLEVPVSIIIDGNEAYHGFVVLVKLALIAQGYCEETINTLRGCGWHTIKLQGLDVGKVGFV